MNLLMIVYLLDVTKVIVPTNIYYSQDLLKYKMNKLPICLL